MTPTLPDGWRLADHEVYGRIIVTNTTPDSEGRVYFVFSDTYTLGYDWDPCPPDELTYIDGEGDHPE